MTSTPGDSGALGTLESKALAADAGFVPLPRRNWFVRMREPGLSVLFLLVVLAAWEVTSRLWVDPIWISSPTLVLGRLGEGLVDGSLLTNTWVTMQEALIGLVLGTVAGVIAGLILSRLRRLAKLLDPYILGFYSLPRIALAPFFVLWLGIGLASKVALVVSVVFFVVLFNVRQGIATVDPDLLDAMKSMQASQRVITRHIMMPTLAPWILSAVEISVGLALVSAVVAEMVGSTAGLGWYVTRSLNQFDMTGGITALLIMAALAMGLYYLLASAQRRMFKWRQDRASSGTVPG